MNPINVFAQFSVQIDFANVRRFSTWKECFQKRIEPIADQIFGVMIHMPFGKYELGKKRNHFYARQLVPHDRQGFCSTLSDGVTFLRDEIGLEVWLYLGCPEGSNKDIENEVKFHCDLQPQGIVFDACNYFGREQRETYNVCISNKVRMGFEGQPRQSISTFPVDCWQYLNVQRYARILTGDLRAQPQHGLPVEAPLDERKRFVLIPNDKGGNAHQLEQAARIFDIEGNTTQHILHRVLIDPSTVPVVPSTWFRRAK